VKNGNCTFLCLFRKWKKLNFPPHRNGFTNHRPSKRARFSSQYATPISFEKEELSELWWGAVQSDTLLANGLPQIPYPSSSSVSDLTPPQTKHPDPTPTSKLRPRPKRRKKGSGPTPATDEQPKSLLALMNNNIKTMKRVRHTHARFAALNLNMGAGGGDEDGEGGGGGGAGGLGMAMGTVFGAGQGVAVAVAQDEDGIDAVDDKVDERPWSARIKGKSGRRISGIEIGDRIAADCVQWMGGKVLEHAGFQGLFFFCGGWRL
jgi:transcriptional activator SPT7